MGETLPQGSSSLLLMRLSLFPTDAEAWDQFVHRYSGPIYAWCRQRRLQDADARDVTQNVFAALLQKLHQFDRFRGVRFRTWLHQVVENCVKDWCKLRAQREQKGTETVWVLLEGEEARRDLQSRLDEEFDLELLELAEMRVRLRVEPRSWQAYELFCKQQLSLKQAAERIGIPPGHVSTYARRVRAMVAREIEQDEQSNGAP
ncbi:MAG TPA: sigma-70 family RNA polymerase sigma factor [Gemmataceae bacterium]|jgi:RNA polymerase sigma factor (sigma-70 family)|nr:sigma-70 family RNA polymerase sigma factor [Gemmataceae bacterium]